MKPRDHPGRREVRVVARPASRSRGDVADAISEAIAKAIREDENSEKNGEDENSNGGYFVRAVLVSCDHVDAKTKLPRGTRHPVTVVFWPGPEPIT